MRRVMGLMMIGGMGFVHAGRVEVRADLIEYDDEAAWREATCERTSIDFDGFVGPISTQFPGLTFSSFNGGNPRAAGRGYAHGAPNVMDVNVSGNGGGGGWALDFESPAAGVGFWTIDTQFPGSTITFYDADGNSLGSSEFSYPHPSAWVFTGFVSTGAPVARLEVFVAANDYIAHDDLQYGAADCDQCEGTLQLKCKPNRNKIVVKLRDMIDGLYTVQTTCGGSMDVTVSGGKGKAKFKNVEVPGCVASVKDCANLTGTCP